MTTYLFEIYKYVEVEANDEDEATDKMWEIVEEEGTEDLIAELEQVTEDDGSIHYMR